MGGIAGNWRVRLTRVGWRRGAGGACVARRRVERVAAEERKGERGEGERLGLT